MIPSQGDWRSVVSAAGPEQTRGGACCKMCLFDIFATLHPVTSLCPSSALSKYGRWRVKYTREQRLLLTVHMDGAGGGVPY